jgi:hypothetical protein
METKTNVMNVDSAFIPCGGDSKLVSGKKSHVKLVPCHHGMARLQVADGGNGLQTWRVAANILNKQSQTADMG